MRILHLAYEDPRQPGSGGGSRRTVEINRRLGARHQITALVAAYPGARPRVEDGIEWVPVGPRTGTKLDRLAYLARVGVEVARRPHDLLVDEFSAPFGPGYAPLLGRAPVIASVQWLFARQMREKYHLPFDWVERTGIRLYDHFIAVSGWLGGRLRALRPRATVEVVPNGVEAAAFAQRTRVRSHLLFLGRLDAHQKGGDLLFPIYARMHATLGEQTPPLLIAGDGPDRESMEADARRTGLAGRIRFLGRIDGPAKYQLMADASAVLVPSRYETFGMVAAEALASGAPVVAFGIGPLREVCGAGARLVPPFDLDAFARAAVDCAGNANLADELGAAGRAWARRYNWDEIAAHQEAVYERRLAGRDAHSPRPRRRYAYDRTGG